MESALVGRTVAKETGAYLIRAAVARRKARSDRDIMTRAHDAVGAQNATVAVGDMHRAAFALAVAGRLSKQLRHHVLQIAALRQMSGAASAPPDPELKAHIDEAEKAAQLYDASRNTGNEVLDVVLTEKSLLCESRRIQLNAVTDGSCLNFFEASDLYALFANMLDHAIESAVKVSEPERRCIDLLVCTRQSFVVVNVISPDRPAESADTRAAHYAVKVTNRIVQKYKGTLTTESQNGFFAVKIIFPQRG